MSFVTAGPAVHRVRVIGSQGSLTDDHAWLTAYQVEAATPEDLTVNEIRQGPEHVSIY